MNEDQIGVTLLTVAQVAERKQVHRTTVLRWIEKGLLAYPASQEQLGQLVAKNLLKGIPPHKVYLIPLSALVDIEKYRDYPSNTKRPRRGKTTGAGDPQRT